nr:hypothetical protein CFP56_12752 [Quercus suber]
MFCCFYEGEREKSGASVLGCGAEQLACFNWRLTRQSRESGEWEGKLVLGLGKRLEPLAIAYACLFMPVNA